jgi:hypothetical protein
LIFLGLFGGVVGGFAVMFLSVAPRSEQTKLNSFQDKVITAAMFAMVGVAAYVVASTLLLQSEHESAIDALQTGGVRCSLFTMDSAMLGLGSSGCGW